MPSPHDNDAVTISARDVYKSFRGKRVLSGLDLDVRRGETLVIIGRSGCGKSVFLKHIIGIMKPDSGRISIDGVDITGLKGDTLNNIRRKFGMVFQGAALFDSLTVGQNVGFYLYEYTQTDPAEIRETVEEKLRLVGMEGIQELKPAELSGGMKKRVSLARAIAHDPGIVLYDEPTTGLDPIMADVINELIIKLSEQLDVTSVVVTHDMVSAYKIADRIAMMYGGKIIAVGSAQEIKESQDPFVQQFVTGRAVGPIDVIGGA